MLLKTLPLLLVIGTALALMPVQAKIPADRTLMDIMRQPNTVNSELSESCFDYYIPMLKNVSAKYDNDIVECKENSANESEAKACIRNAENDYVASSSGVYDKLANCLEGNGIH